MTERIEADVVSAQREAAIEGLLATYPISETLQQHGLDVCLAPALAAQFVDYDRAVTTGYSSLWKSLAASLAERVPAQVYKDAHLRHGDRALEAVWAFGCTDTETVPPRDVKVSMALPWSTAAGSPVEGAIDTVNSGRTIRQTVFGIAPSREHWFSRRRVSQPALRQALGKWVCRRANTISVVEFAKDIDDPGDLVSKDNETFYSFPQVREAYKPGSRSLIDPAVLARDLDRLENSLESPQTLWEALQAEMRLNQSEIDFCRRQTPRLQRFAQIARYGLELESTDPAVQPGLVFPAERIELIVRLATSRA